MARNMAADCLAALIAMAVKTHGLSLIPIVAVGHAEGADLAAQLALKHGSLLGSCILLSPTTFAMPVPAGTLDGMHVLLVRTASEKTPGSVGRQICNVFEKAGAAVICERIPRRRSLGPRETVIARVFVAALFGGV